MSEPLLLTVKDAVATVSVNGAPYNLMTLDYIDALRELFPKLVADNDVRAIVFTAEGDEHFSAGMNLKQIPEGMQRAGSPEAFFKERLDLLDLIETCGKPSVATLFGFCLGAGLELPLACHFRLAAAEGAQIGLPEMDLGAVPAWGGSARLPRCVGRDHALDMILRSKKIDGPEALRIGLVNEVWPLEELKQKAQELARTLASQPRLAVQGVLETIVGFESKTLAESIADEQRAVAKNRGTADSREGMQAFLEKRKPVFNQA